jgi:hypothetical protein
MSYTPAEYEYVRRMNLLMNTWDVPTVNLLGALDDGTGRYVIGFDSDDRHPNAAGHHELFYTFVPSLFEALEKGKPLPTRPTDATGYARILRSAGPAPLTLTPDGVMHSFAISFRARAHGDGIIASIAGSTLAARTETKQAGQREYASMTLTQDQPFTASIDVRNDKWVYEKGAGAAIRSDDTAGSKWHDVVLSHYTARGETLFFVDGKLVGKFAERLQPNKFALGGSDADYKDLFIFRSALNADEVSALHEGKMLQASLEVYAPLNDAQFPQDQAVENRAQSLSLVKVTGRIVHGN